MQYNTVNNVHDFWYNYFVTGEDFLYFVIKQRSLKGAIILKIDCRILLLLRDMWLCLKKLPYLRGSMNDKLHDFLKKFEFVSCHVYWDQQKLQILFIKNRKRKILLHRPFLVFFYLRHFLYIHMSVKGNISRDILNSPKFADLNFIPRHGPQVVCCYVVYGMPPFVRGEKIARHGTFWES